MNSLEAVKRAEKAGKFRFIRDHLQYVLFKFFTYSLQLNNDCSYFAFRWLLLEFAFRYFPMARSLQLTAKVTGSLRTDWIPSFLNRVVAGK